jgi:tetratricopeptide (TPR) repeat protein
MKKVLVVAVLVGALVFSRIDVSFATNLFAIRWAKILIEQQTPGSCQFPYYRPGQLSGATHGSLGDIAAIEQGLESKRAPAPYVLAVWTLSSDAVPDDVLWAICDERHPAARVVCTVSPLSLEKDSYEEANQERVDLFFVKMGKCFVRDLQYDEAETAYSIAIELAPEYGDAQLALARLYQGLGDLEAALIHYEKAEGAFEEESPGLGLSMASFYTSYGDALLGHGSLEQAEQKYSLALTHSPDYANSWLGLARIRYETEDMGKALEYLAISNRLSPTNAKAHYWMGRVFVERGDLDGAILLLQESRMLAADRQATLWALARAYEARGLWREAAQAYCDLSLLDPQDSAADRELDRLNKEVSSQIRCPTGE